jgi:hypothetical protein
LLSKQGLVRGTERRIERAGGGYQLSVKANPGRHRNVIASERGRASDRNQVLQTATKLIAGVRSALGDDRVRIDQLFKAASMSAHLARRHPALCGRPAGGVEQPVRGGTGTYRKAVALDPKFGIGYQALAAVSLNLGASKDAEGYAKEALSAPRRHDAARGVQHPRPVLPHDRRLPAVRQGKYGDLISAYPADVAGHNNLALCATYLRDLPKAIDEMQRVVAMLPKRDLYRVNLALYSNYAGEFQAAEREARAIQTPDVKALTALAFAQTRAGEAGRGVRDV